MNAHEGIHAGDQSIADGVNNGDAALSAAQYLEDGAVLPPGTPRQDGRAAVQAFWQGAIDMGFGDVKLRTDEIEDLGSVATAVGTFSGTVPDGEGGRTTVGGKYMLIWRKDADGTWRVHRDIWNFDG